MADRNKILRMEVVYSPELMLFQSWHMDDTFHTLLPMEIMLEALLKCLLSLITLKELYALVVCHSFHLAFSQFFHDSIFLSPQLLAKFFHDHLFQSPGPQPKIFHDVPYIQGIIQTWLFFIPSPLLSIRIRFALALQLSSIIEIWTLDLFLLSGHANAQADDKSAAHHNGPGSVLPLTPTPGIFPPCPHG